MNPGMLPAHRRMYLRAGGAWVLALVVCGVIWMLWLSGDLRRLRLARQRTEALSETIRQMERDIAARPRLDAEAAEVGVNLHAITNAHVLVPLLNSYAMMAKAWVAEPAAKAGFTIVDVQERHRVPLPVHNPRATLHFDRFGIEVTGEGSYASAARFVEEIERARPYAALVGLTVLGRAPTPETHRVVVLLEWPVQGTPPPPPPPPPRDASRRDAAAGASP